MRWLVLCLCLAGLARAEERGFDYYVLSLSWSPTWCALTGDARGAAQCETGIGWSLHGLWPQYRRGYPSDCQTAERPPNRPMTAEMADIMGSSGLAWYQWQKHGTCSGLPAADYYAQARAAYEGIKRPAVFRKLEEAVKLPASVVEDAFIKANPELHRDMITITCRQGHIQEARICLSKALQPILCGADVVQDCRLRDARLTPVRD